MADIKLNVKLNRGLYSREACTETQRLMSCYVLAESKHSGKTYLELMLSAAKENLTAIPV